MAHSVEAIYLDTLSRAIDTRAQVFAVLLDGEGIMRRANAFAEQIAGTPLAGKPFRDFVVDFNENFDLRAFVAPEKRSDPQALSISTAQGLPKTFYFSSVSHTPYTLLLGETSGSDLDLLRKNLTETNAELSNMSRRFQKANAQLTKLNEQKNQFLGIAAHDLRNPLASVLGLCDFLLEDSEGKNDEEIAFINSIKSSSRYMLDLLEDLLDITRIESGKLNLDLQPASLADLIRRNLEINIPIAKRKGISLRFCCKEDLPLVYLDPMKIEQVLNNLFSNAIKFSHSGTAVEVGLFRSGDYATFKITDQGIGIAAKDLEQVFQPFARLTSHGTAGESSTGLGLAIVQRIIIGHKGRIWVESEEGSGTTFFFTLPLSTDA